MHGRVFKIFIYGSRIQKIYSYQLEGLRCSSRICFLNAFDISLSLSGFNVGARSQGRTFSSTFKGHSCPFLRYFIWDKGEGHCFLWLLIASDTGCSFFDELYSVMPWLTLPFPLEIQGQICCGAKLKVRHIPTLVAVSPTWQTITNNAADLMLALRSDAYPFTSERVKDMVKALPERLKHLPMPNYACDGCKEFGSAWSPL